jgi:hypothetical protein
MKVEFNLRDTSGGPVEGVIHNTIHHLASGQR